MNNKYAKIFFAGMPNFMDADWIVNKTKIQNETEPNYLTKGYNIFEEIISPQFMYIIGYRTVTTSN